SRIRFMALFALVAAGGACKPDLDQRTDLVKAPRVLAVRAEPAEVAPGDSVTLTTLYVDPNGVITPETAGFDWAFCNDRKPLAGLGRVSGGCANGGGVFSLEPGGAPTVRGGGPADACRNFGPEVPQPEPNQPAGRPVDPDSTGGFYQPVRLATRDQTAIGRVR